VVRTTGVWRKEPIFPEKIWAEILKLQAKMKTVFDFKKWHPTFAEK